MSIVKPFAMTLTFMTGREDPHLDWLLDGLASQMRDDDQIELIVVDGFPGRPHRDPWFSPMDDTPPKRATPSPPIGERELAILRRSELGALVVRGVRPKPSIWQGPHRITPQDFWATANSRNTAICLASHPYIAFIDDRSRLGPKWLSTLRIAASRPLALQSVACGTYDKLEDGKRTTDHRRGISPNGKINCGGQWLYGCTFGLPLEWALGVNGLEEGCDSLTGEDYIFGLMLQNAGRRIDFSTDLYVEQDRSLGTEHPFKSTDKGIAPDDKSHAALAWFGKARRTVFTPDLREIRRELAAGGTFPVPDPSADYRDWYDGANIREMRIE